MENKFSVGKTIIIFIGGKVIKEYRLKTIKPVYKDKVGELILEYYKSLISNNIPVPKLIEYKDLIFVSDHHGKNIIELAGNNIEEFYEHNKPIFYDALKIIKTAKENKLYLDPHIKNFTIYDTKIYYVDIFPPYCQKYLEVLLKSNPDQRKRIMENYKIFSPKMIPHHFLADLLSVFNNEEIIKDLAEKMIEMNIIDYLDMDKVKKIMEIDRLRKSPDNDKYDLH